MVWESVDLARLLVLLGKFQSVVLIFHRLTRLFEILSIAFELAEYSLQHQLANFAEVCVYLGVIPCSPATELASSAGGTTSGPSLFLYLMVMFSTSCLVVGLGRIDM